MFTLSYHLWALTTHRVLSLSEMRLTRIPPLSTSSTNANSEFDKKAVSFRTVLSNQYLYTASHLHRGRPKGRFKRNPLSPGSNDILLLPPNDPNSWTRTGFDPRPDWSRASISSGVDPQASGLTCVTNRELTRRTSPIAGLRAIWFPYDCALNKLSLATQINSLARASGRTRRHRSDSLTRGLLHFALTIVVSFMPPLSVT